MKKRTEFKIKQLGIILTIWLIIGFIITFYDYLVLHTQYSKGPSAEYSFLFSLGMNMGSALVGALLGGSFLVFFVNVKYNDRPYGHTILAVALS